MYRKLKNLFLDLLFPRQCIGCKTNDTWLCQTCFQLIQANKQQVCYICRQASPSGKTCSKHLNKTRTLDGLLVAAHYSGNPFLKKAIYTLKYKHHPEDIAEKLGILLSQTFQKYFPHHLNSLHRPYSPTFLPIPLHPKRLRERGFNQSELISKFLFSNYPEGTLNRSKDEILTRATYTPPQAHTKSRQERLNNLKNAFALQGKVDPQTTYLLVDDIVTTGTTLEECCQLLKNNGANKVWGLVLARN